MAQELTALDLNFERRQNLSLDAKRHYSIVSCSNEINRSLPVLRVSVAICRNRRRTEFIKWQEELHFTVNIDEILKQKEIYVAVKVQKEVEEVGVSSKSLREWTFYL